MKKIRFVGPDVHAETIAVAVAEPNGEVRSLGTIPDRESSVRRLVKKLGPPQQSRMFYEAGPTGYALLTRSLHIAFFAELLTVGASGEMGTLS